MPEKENVSLEELKKLADNSEKIAREIRMISRAFKKMAAGGLKEETLVLLIHASSNVGKPDVRGVLKAIRELEVEYTKPEKVEK